ncbi:MAG: DEAD/DEAH box helicase [Fretibacterium sp.]|nr:DEAD/DEAH box helicase [Fretibacterium sp.]
MARIDRPVLKDLNEAGELWQIGGAVLERGGGAARAWACPAGRVLAVLPDLRQATEFAGNCRRLGRESLLLSEPPLTSQGIESRPLRLERGEVLRRWVQEPEGVLAATPGALMAPCLLGTVELTVRKGESSRRDSLVAWLELGGYQRVDLVWYPGQYAVRGFILDVFDPAHAMPLRFEFMDDEVERIVLFHPATQMSRGRRTDPVDLDEISLHGLEKVRPAAPVELLPGDTRVLICDPRRTETQAHSFRWLWRELCSEEIPEWDETFHALAELPHLRLTDAAQDADAELPFEELPPFRGDAGSAVRLCQELRAEGCAISVYTTNPRFLDLKGGPLSRAGDLEIHEGTLTSGFVDRGARRAFLSDRELSGIMAGLEADAEDNLPRAGAVPIEWRDRLSPGQLVIHEDYGLCAFRGIETVSRVGRTGAGLLPSRSLPPVDELVLEFAQGQRLLIPVLQSSKLTPLAEHENEETQLDSLRGTRWKRSVERDRQRAREEAKVLMEIFARREMERRPSWDEPGELYAEFVRAFPYAETADQLRAVSEIMADLSGPFPMDRLLVGDVGFGKTEVALRAAFRAVNSGYQVCVLVPTTILAQQHYETFRSRLAGFPVSVGLLSRFVSKKDITQILKRAAEGTVDIVIGTHKLLQDGVAFKRLGLLVIDEEHRFGVMHKEGLKRAYGSVDILSLSATPIPRTLAMALQGLRSISVLSTPPQDRLPVTTFAGPWDTALVRKAITYELNRGGQVYFLSNRISRMEDQHKMLSAFFPEARIRIAHGQMRERELESTMMEFYSGRIDILVATTIIESGLDVGRANTIIIDDSQELGLAQMYQLRGRVGRRGENAFAYFFYPDREGLRQDTADRLEAISTMTELGSGYAIARRDLDIRGGGEVGGTKQHGSSRAASFHLFYRMLEQELERLRGVEMKLTDLRLTWESGAGASIPPAYIPQEEVRVTLCRRLVKAVGVDELYSLMEEMRDRFGVLPEETRLLCALTAIRNFGGHFGLETVTVGEKETSAAGSLEELAPHLRGQGGWVVLGSHAEGPAGLEGALGLFEAMRRANKQ